MIHFTATGVGRSVAVPSPSWPSTLLPQHSIEPEASIAQLCATPAAIVVALVSPLTATDVEESAVVPLPSWPFPFAPQHRAVPSRSATHECAPGPALIDPGPETPLTAMGIGELVVVPLPSWPFGFAPQHFAVLSASVAHV